MILLIKLLLAHLFGDFIFQPSSWVREKENKKFRAWQFYAHVLSHGLLIFVFTYDQKLWLPAVIIMVSHGIIDGAKIQFQTSGTRNLWFAIDQALHVAVIAITWYVIERPELDLAYFNSIEFLSLFTAIVFITTPASVIIRTLVARWTPKTAVHANNAAMNEDESLPEAGKFIGIIERLLTLAFILINHWEAIGFLLAAKSIFRFGDLKEAHDRRLTEYVLIGTLLSFSIAILTGLLLLVMR
jgi:hypothetical protein